MSSVYWPLPVMNRWSSLRRTGAPIPVVAATGFPPVAVSFCLRAAALGSAPGSGLFGGLAHAAHIGGGCFHGGDDVVVAGAAAQVALEPLADGVVVELAARALHEVDGGHDHARGAEAALQAVVLAA